MNPNQLSRETRLQLASDPNADAETLKAAFYLRDDEICLAIAKHPNASAVTLGSLAYSGNDRIRDAVARNRNTSDLHLAKLASDCCSAIVEAVARRKDVSPHVLALLAAQPFDLFKGCHDDEETFDERDLNGTGPAQSTECGGLSENCIPRRPQVEPIHANTQHFLKQSVAYLSLSKGANRSALTARI
jgi:hypothetical protein